MKQQKNDRQRIIIAAVFAIVAHVFLILGINFTAFSDVRQLPVLSLNVSLVQRVSGELNAASAEVLMPVTPVQPDMVIPQSGIATAQPFQSASAGHTELVVTTEPRSVTTPRNRTDTSSVTSPRLSTEPSPNTAPPSPRSPVQPRLDRLQALPSDMRSEPDADLHLARMEVVPDNTTLSPREKYIDVFDTSTLEGFYAENWRLKVEKMGTLHFPAEAREQNLIGKLTLDVAINSDGTVHSIRLLQSSGYDVLDRAARRIVYLAGPFSPFPEVLGRRYDLLHIVRTWEFDQGNRLNSD